MNLRCLLFLVTNGNLTLVFHEGVNSIRADKSLPLVSIKCLNKKNKILLFLVTNGNKWYMGVNSVRADNLSPLVSRILNKNEVNVFGQLLCVCSSSLMFLIHGHFMTFVSV